MKSKAQEVAGYLFRWSKLTSSSCATHYFVVGDSERPFNCRHFQFSRTEIHYSLSLEENAEQLFIFDSHSFVPFKRAIF